MPLNITLKHLLFVTLLCTQFGTSALLAQREEQGPARQVSFRNSQVEIKSIQLPADAGSSELTGNSEEDLLADKLQAAESELHFSKAKLESARKTLESQTAAKNFEKADITEVSVKDWEARVKEREEKLAQIRKEMQVSMQKAPPEETAEDNIILPGETIEVFVVEDPSFNSRYQVRRGGYIILPAVGRIAVAGKTIKEAEKAVRAALQSSQLKNASVMIERIQGADVENGPVVYLSGEFKQPRPFRIPAGTKATLVSCILSSGGVTDKADLTHVRIMRMAGNKGVVEEVNVEKILQGGGLGSDLTLDEGDVVTIPGGATNVVFLTGNVKTQGSFLLQPGDRLSAYSAILQKGGFAHFANEKKVFILRATPDGTKVKIPVNVAAIKKGEAADIPLQGNDIIVVPEKFFSF